MTKPSLRTSLPPADLALRQLTATLAELNERTDLSEAWRLAHALDCVADWAGWHVVARTPLDDDRITVSYRRTGGPL